MKIKYFPDTKYVVSRSEKVVIVVVLFAFLLISLVQVFRLTSLSPWQDQIMFIDPAANLYFGNGFTSSAWFAQTKDEFWAGYPSLYSFLLYLWMRLFGFGIYTARSFNCVLTATCAVMLWQAVIRLKLISSPNNRLILITLLLLQLGYTNNAEQGRPDALMASLALLALLAYSIQVVWLRYLSLTGLCILFPFGGLALSAYTVVLSVLLLIYLRKLFLGELIAIIFGLLLGFLCTYSLYSANGVWDDFIISTLNNPTILAFSQRDKIGGIFGNRILQVLVISCFALVIHKVLKGEFKWVSVPSFGLAAIFWIPLGMRLAGAFQFCYSWMVVVPLGVCVCFSVDKLLKTTLDRRLNSPILGIIIVLCLISSPYLSFIDLVLNWNSSNYFRIEAFVQENISSDEWVLSDPISYFAAKKGGKTVIYKPYLTVISPQEKEKVSVLIVRPQDSSLLQAKLGGKWHKRGKPLTIQYKKEVVELDIYRRGEF